MKGIFQALSYLHDTMNVIHRDIKPENMLIGDYEDLSKIKLIDFGLAVEYTKDNILDFAKCGTLLYTPPEQVAKNFMYAKKADMWAAGITLFELLTGYHPLYESGDHHQ
jgi:serine/threonine protein kinase